ncbi:hypothetical protein I302_106092 [Kwoniella bestiolae CBS 10118]|uniref:tRNA dimethylallyltransferase n=1 Tax=Kwoniella bestiolae CBS 10118 TaxID=1296100 RepID=A0AAJ8KAB7_9TREE
MSTPHIAKQRPVVAVIGTTGVGKSNLAVALAQSLGRSPRTANGSGIPLDGAPYPAVVLSADSMQLYKGLDVITNKVTEEEKGGVEHWGLDMVSPGQGGSWEVGKWCNEADKKIATLPENSLPIVCGGTHYFIQHFLFPPPELSFDRPTTPSAKGKSPVDPSALRWTPPGPRPPIPETLEPEMIRLLDTFWNTTPEWPQSVTDNNAETPAEPSSSKASRPTIYEDAQLLALHQLLCALDPKEGGRWHWRDGRKVRRGLERWWERGGSIESAPQTTDGPQAGVDAKGRRARFRTLIFWVYEPLESLRPRLDKRVDKMVENGLLREISELRDIAKQIYGTTEATDHTEGIFQSIGYKEFSSLALPQPQPTSDSAYGPALERTKLSTHQYAKSQLKWIKKQLLPAVKEAKSLGGDVGVYVVNGGEKGVEPALNVFRAFMTGQQLPKAEDVGHADTPSLLDVLNDHGSSKVPDTADRQDINARRDCEACSTIGRPYSLSVKEWDAHVKSRFHKRNANPVKRDKDEWIAQQRAQGEAKRAERDRLKGELSALKLQQEQLKDDNSIV